MLTNELITFFKGPVISGLATVNSSGQPFFTRSLLVEGKENEAFLDVFIPEVMSSRPLEDIKSNDRIALVLADVTNFKANQFKGKVEDVIPATSAEISRMQQGLNELSPILGNFFGPGAAAGWNRYIIDPSVKISFRVEEIYEQTPGPGTGGRIK